MIRWIKSCINARKGFQIEYDRLMDVEKEIEALSRVPVHSMKKYEHSGEFRIPADVDARLVELYEERKIVCERLGLSQKHWKPFGGRPVVYD